MKAAFRVEQAGAAGVGARELDRRLDAFAARVGEEDPLQSAAGARDEALRQFGGQLRDVALQHRGTGAVQLFLEGGDDRRMIVAGVVHAVAGKEIENPAAIGGEQLAPRAALVLHVHLQQVEQLDPLRIHVVGVEAVQRRDGGSG